MDCTKCGGRGEYYGIGSTGRFRDEPMMRDCDRCGRTGIEPGTNGATATGSAPAGGCLSMLFGWLAGWLARIVLALVGLAVLGAIVFETEAYPGNGRLDDLAAATCPEHFEDYVGATPGDTDLSIGSRSPTETEWRIRSRRVLCFVGGGPNGTLTGAIAGSGGRAGGQ